MANDRIVLKNFEKRTQGRGGGSQSNQTSTQTNNKVIGARTSTQTTPANTQTGTVSETGTNNKTESRTNTGASNSTSTGTNGSTTNKDDVTTSVETEDSGGIISFRVLLKGGLFTDSSNPLVCPV